MLFALNPWKRNDKHGSDRTMTTLSPILQAAILLTGMFVLGACPARADEMPTAGPGAEASRLVEEVLRKAGDGALGEWTGSIMDRALERAGETARRTVPGSGSGTGPGQTAPLPAERHADALAAPRPSSAEVLVFTSLSVPAASWRQWAHDAARTGTPLVLRGVGAGPGSGSGTGGLRQTVGAIRVRLGSHEPGIAIDPRLFRLFGIDRVPAVVVVPGGVPPCESRGCAGDPAPPHDLIAGNIGLVAAMEAVAEEGDVGREVAKAHLGRLRKGNRP